MKPQSLEEVQEKMENVDPREAKDLLDRWELSTSFLAVTEVLNSEGYTREMAEAADPHFEAFFNALRSAISDIEITLRVGRQTFQIERASSIFDLAEDAMADDEDTESPN